MSPASEPGGSSEEKLDEKPSEVTIEESLKAGTEKMENTMKAEEEMVESETKDHVFVEEVKNSEPDEKEKSEENAKENNLSANGDIESSNEAITEDLEKGNLVTVETTETNLDEKITADEKSKNEAAEETTDKLNDEEKNVTKTEGINEIQTKHEDDLNLAKAQKQKQTNITQEMLQEETNKSHPKSKKKMGSEQLKDVKKATTKTEEANDQQTKHENDSNLIEAQKLEQEADEQETIKNETPKSKPKSKKEVASIEKKRELASNVDGEISSKRSRKSADAFKPDDFGSPEKNFQVIPGRGKPLENLGPCRISIEKTPADADVLLLAHRLLFSVKGKPSKKDLKKNLLKFSGFLSAKIDPSIKKQTKIDLDDEAKMGQKAYKLKVSELKALCDLFAIDKPSVKGKDGLVDALLDFLGEPTEIFLKNKGSKMKASRKPVDSEMDVDDDDDKDNEEENENEFEDMDMDMDMDKDKEEIKTKTKKRDGKGNSKKSIEKVKSKGSPLRSALKEKPKKSGGIIPSDRDLRAWVRNYAYCHNSEDLTVEDMIKGANQYFGMNLMPQKSRVNVLLDEVRTGVVNKPSDQDLYNWVHNYVNCHDMEVSTVNGAIAIASRYFGMDLFPQKPRVKNLLAEAL